LDLVQEEFQQNTEGGTYFKEVEENFTLSSKENKAKGKNSQGKEGGKKMYLMRVKCFHCHEHRHYATNWPQNKARRKEPAVAAIGEVLASQFKLDFTLIACIANAVMGDVWHFDSSASFHMTGNRDLFSDFKEKYLEKSIEFGDDERYSATGLGMVTFQREYSSPLRITYVMYVVRLKKNLVSVAVLEDYGYDVVFSKGKVFLKHIATEQVKQIGA